MLAGSKMLGARGAGSLGTEVGGSRAVKRFWGVVADIVLFKPRGWRASQRSIYASAALSAFVASNERER
jgi:hypothetical protein